MKNLLLLCVVALASLSCVEEVEDTDPLDDEFGVGVAIDGKADNASIRPGSPEATALLNFVNQHLADDAAADAFFTLLDTKLHRIAARNIVNARRGVDRTMGTSDDFTFSDLNELDKVRFVGRSAMMRLFDLARDAGYFGPPVSCNEVLQRVNRNVRLSTLQELVEIENSGCTSFEKDLEIDFEGTLLPRYRSLHALDSVESVGGVFKITSTRALEHPRLRGLKKIYKIEGQYLRGDYSRSMLPNVEEVRLLDIRYFDYHFPALKKSHVMIIDALTMNKFANLEEVTSEIDIYSRPSADNDLTLDMFANLKKVNTIYIDLDERKVTITGLGELESAERIISDSTLIVEFPKLKTLSSLRISKPQKFVGMMPLLTSVNDIEAYADVYPFPELESADSFILGSSNRSAMFSPSKLKKVSGKMVVSGNLSEYNSLEETGSIDFSCTLQSTWNGFNALSDPGRFLSISVEECGVEGMSSVEFTEANISLYVAFGGSFSALENLVLSGGVVVRDETTMQLGFFPKLEVAGGSLVYFGSLNAPGFDLLESVEGSFDIRGIETISGFPKLNSIGGSYLSLPRNMSVADRDAFLNQIEHFSGSIRAN